MVFVDQVHLDPLESGNFPRAAIGRRVGKNWIGLNGLASNGSNTVCMASDILMASWIKLSRVCPLSRSFNDEFGW